ncbi:AraC family transcriptional regulator [Chitinophaga qingshengii]|uniref:AraC family transcriptional regulator n=1 Tax=Chitinophaga qingshengii TaxID=1569794 RepID=A0ABR7TS76_9BACT|nr:helix-turn-helix domain-containing protein [Chitinophaga qingshengii]MBC9932249.1 AraC family transcriptional regulator [Chitinophaga qingshengii]
MKATVQQPCAELKDAIDYYWYHETPKLQQSVYNIPFLHQELVINLGGAFTMTPQGQDPFAYSRSGGISGLFSQPVMTRVSGHYKAIGILFKPFGLYRLFGLSAAMLQAGPLSGNQLWGAFTGQLVEQLEAQPSAAEKLKTLERFLLAHARPHVVPSVITDHSLPVSLTRGHIKTLQQAQQVSPKKYIQQFQQAVGSTPKKYIQLQLINASLAQIADNPAIPLTEVAYDNGFYDQAHFIRVFKSFAGMTPLQYKKAVQAGLVQVSFPNAIIQR